jgi:hypothetical protein
MRLLVLVSATFFGTASVIVPPPAQAVSLPVQPDLFGIHDFHVNAPLPYGAVRLWDGHTTWADLEPLRGRYQFSHLDALVKVALARHVKVTLVLGSTPAWAAADPSSAPVVWLPVGTSSPPRDLADWVGYVTTVASRYRGRIDSYQIWNEPSKALFWNGTMQQLAGLTAAAYPAIKAADPQAQVVAAPLLQRQTNWQARSTAYLVALRNAGWPVDVFALHSYQTNRLGNPDGRVAVIKATEAILRAVHAPARPLWDTEANFSSNAYTAHKITGDRAAGWIARAYLDSLRLGIARTFWYAWNTPTIKLGVTLGPKSLAARGYASVRRWLVGSTFRGCTSSRASRGATMTSCSFLRGGKASRVVWASADVGTPLTGHGGTVCGLLKACRARTGRSTVGSSPVLVR